MRLESIMRLSASTSGFLALLLFYFLDYMLSAMYMPIACEGQKRA